MWKECARSPTELKKLTPPDSYTTNDGTRTYTWSKPRCVVKVDINVPDQSSQQHLWDAELMELEGLIIKDGQDEIYCGGDGEVIEIQLVYISEKGYCSRGVASVLHALLVTLNDNHLYPEIGKVHVKSKNPCAAVNCYNRAFLMNGYTMTRSSFDNLKEVKKNEEGEIDGYLYFRSDQQTLKKHADEEGKTTQYDILKL